MTILWAVDRACAGDHYTTKYQFALLAMARLEIGRDNASEGEEEGRLILFHRNPA